MRIAGFVISFFLIAFFSCKETDIVPLPDGRDYFPLEVGRLLEYRIDSIIFDDIQGGNVQDTFSGYMRESVTAKIEGLTGDTAYIIERSFRRTETEPWVITNIYTESTDESFAFRQEGNLTQVKMKFPLRDSTRWEPTAFIDPEIEVEVGTELIKMFSSWEGLALNLDRSETVGSFNFDKVLTCRQADDDNDLERRFVLEKYAEGIGLVLRVDSILDSRCLRLGEILPCLESDGNGNLVPQPWIDMAEKGYILRQEITNFK
jgi:hypothetical protein